MVEGSEEGVYELLIELWRKERESEKPVKLPEDLEQRLREYMGSIKHYLKVSDKQSLSTELKEAEMEAVNKLLNSLFELRLRKLLRMAERGEPLKNLLGFEEKIYLSLSKLIRDYKESVREIAMAAAYRDWAQLRSSYELVYFLEDIPTRIVGADLKTYGPFKRGDIATLPVENARALELRGAVKIFKVLEPAVEG